MKTFLRVMFAGAFLLNVSLAAHAQDDASGTPLEDITQDMKVAANHLSKKTTDKATQDPQEDAVARLDKLIEELEKERNSMGNSSNPNPTRPAMTSSVRNGPGGMGDLHGTRDQGDRWGQLPPHERDRILQSLTEGFPAHYQAILEAYYKRLAVEKRAEATDDEPPAAPKANSKPAAKETSAAKEAAPAKTTPAASTKPAMSAKKAKK